MISNMRPSNKRIIIITQQCVSSVLIAVSERQVQEAAQCYETTVQSHHWCTSIDE